MAASVHDEATGGAGERPAPLFVLDGVGFSVEGRAILSDISLTLEPGRVHGLIGPNGSGKSTLVKLLARQNRPSAGAIRFEGRPIASDAPRAFAKRLAYLPQSPPVPDATTVAEVVAFGRYPWHGPLGRVSARDREAVETAMARARVETMRNRPLAGLSGGERQRVWLAMLLAQEAGCLVLDEPTSALDVSHQATMLQLVRALADEAGISVVVVLHDINMAARVCDRLIALKTGRVVFDGPPETLMTPERLEEIFDVAMGVLRQPETDRPIGYVA